MMYPMVMTRAGDRDELLMYLESRGIETRYMFPLLSQPIYQKLFPGLDDTCPVAKALASRGFFIGMHQDLTISDMAYISIVIHKYYEEHQ